MKADMRLSGHRAKAAVSHPFCRKDTVIRMGRSYTQLPAFYDFLGNHPDYSGQAKNILERYRETGAKESGLVLDLACGTGKLTLALLQEGADVIGTDISPEMLTVARNRCGKAGFSPLLLLQDMRELDLYGTVDVTVCATNSLNYLETEEDLEKVFSLVHNFLTPGGLFFFDINSRYKFEQLYGENTYVFEGGGGFCVWQNRYRKTRRRADFRITIFKKESSGKYSRLEEEQCQHYFSEKKVEQLLKKTGFGLILKGEDPAGTPVKNCSSDIFYLARCIKDGTKEK